MVAFEIFGFQIYRYGIFYALAFLLGYFGLGWIGKRGFFSQFSQVQHFLTEGLEDLIFTIAMGVLIGGRLGHVLIYGEAYYFQNLSVIVKVREGGMSFIGGIIGVVTAITLLVVIKKMKKSAFLMLFDLILIFVPLGIFFGRFGNFLNQELYGIAVSELPNWLGNLLSTLHLTHIYPKVDQILRVNTNFLSMLLEGILIFIVQVWLFVRQIKQKRRKVGLLASNFLLMYSVVRFGLEYLRADSQMEIIGFLSKSQRFFLVFIVVAIVVMSSKEKVIMNKE